MADWVFVIGVVVIAASALVIAVRFDPGAGEWRGGRKLTLEDVASKYEGDLKGLYWVTAVVPRLEDPAEDPSLKAAVKDNFSRGIGYLFLVSAPRFESALRGYFPVFKQYAREALQARGSNTDEAELERQVEELVRLAPLKTTWEEHPYIFYHCVVGVDRYSLGFRGMERNQGISKWYVTVGREEAAAIYKGLRALIDAAAVEEVEPLLERAGDTDFAAAPARPPRESDAKRPRLVR